MAFHLALFIHFLLCLATFISSEAHSHGFHHEQRNAKQPKGCDYFEGTWVYDESYPIYNTTSCPFIGLGFDCQKNGRPDKDYLQYRWQPTSCDLPRFDGRDFLETYRGKKIMFVGDSISFNTWESLTCMLHTAAPESNYTLRAGTFTFTEYGVSIVVLKNGFLVDMVYDKIGKVLKLDSISSGNSWKGADVVIFNSYHWWTHSGKYQSWDYFQVGDKLVKEMDYLEAYKIALTTWAKWIDTNIDPTKTKVFFQGATAAHVRGTEWKDPKAKTCQGQTEPIEGSMYPGSVHPAVAIVKDVLSKMVKPVYLLDVTLLTQLRKDGHPSIYTGSGAKLVDCSHWCLAGVPDTWNQLLYAALLQK